MARTREFNKQEKIEAVQNLFWEKGFAGTSYADLTSVTDLGKGSLYAAFGNKHALYLDALKFYVEQDILLVGADFLKRHEADPAAWKDRVAELLSVAIDVVENRQDRRGCFLCNAAVDLAPFDADVEQIVLDALADFKNMLLVIIRDAYPAEEAEQQADLLLSTYIGMRVLAKAGIPTAQLTLIRDQALSRL